MADRIRVNYNSYSWGSIIFKLNNERYYGFTEITFGDKRERQHGYGMGKHHAPIRRSRGKYTVEPVKVKGYTSSMQELRKALAALASDGKSYGDVEFQGLVTYIEQDEGDMSVELDRLVWASNTATNSEAPDNLMEEAEFNCMLIRRNGLLLFDSSEGQL